MRSRLKPSVASRARRMRYLLQSAARQRWITRSELVGGFPVDAYRACVSRLWLQKKEDTKMTEEYCRDLNKEVKKGKTDPVCYNHECLFDMACLCGCQWPNLWVASGIWAREGGPPPFPDPCTPHQEQPHLAGGARRWQDGHRRGPRTCYRPWHPC